MSDNQPVRLPNGLFYFNFFSSRAYNANKVSQKAFLILYYTDFAV